MADFEISTIQDAQQITGSNPDPIADVTEMYFDDDAWQDGQGWVGPRPAKGSDGYISIIEEIETGLVWQNCVKEVVVRHRNALIGQEPLWSITPRRTLGFLPSEENPDVLVQETPTDEEQQLITEAETVLLGWWETREALSLLQDACDALLQATRAPMRLFIPPGKLDEDGKLDAPETLADALKLLYLDVPSRKQATVFIVPDTQGHIGVYTYDHKTLEGGKLTAAEQRAEVHEIDENGQTIIRLLGASDEQQESQPYELAGNLGIFEMKRKRFIGSSFNSLQAALVMTMTMMTRNAVQGGFLERIFKNAAMPGKFKINTTTGEEEFKAEPYKTGPGTTNYLVGLEIRNEKGEVTGYTQPDVQFRDPVDPESFLKTKQELYESMLQEVDQLHTIISRDATASGESRLQAAAEFLKSLNKTKTQIEMAGRWMLETALAFASDLAGTPGRFAELRAQFQCRLDVGPISSELQRLAKELATGDDPLISIETAMQRIGIDDPSAELVLIEQRQAKKRELAQEQDPEKTDDREDE